MRPLAFSRLGCALIILAIASSALAAAAKPKAPAKPKPVAPAVPVKAGLIVTPQQIQQAIDRAKAYLYAKQKNGNWEIPAEPNAKGNNSWFQSKGMHHGGMTALSIFALLSSGDNHQDPRLTQAIEFLKTADMTSAYAVGLRCQVWGMLPPRTEIKRLLRADADHLLNTVIAKGPGSGMYTYTVKTPAEWDTSVSQYGVLGVWAAELAGIEIPAGYWKLVDAGWRRVQQKDGGWNYNLDGAAGHKDSTMSTTTAGLASLFITQYYLNADRGGTCRGNLTDPSIEAGLKCIEEKFTGAFGVEHGSNNQQYTLFGIERTAASCGYKYFGKHDWFQVGANWLIQSQNADGSFGAPSNTYGLNFNNVPSTGLALLFLSRGRAPVIINKLRYDEPGSKPDAPRQEGPWNERSRDVDNFVRWMSESIERRLNWQVVGINMGVDELHDAPIVYLSGSSSLNFTPEQVDKLRQYVEEGGLVVVNPNCGKKPFVDSVKKLASAMFHQYEFRELPQDHPIYTNEQFLPKKWDRVPRVLGLSNGVRELMIVLPETDYAGSWHSHSMNSKVAYELPANVMLYAAGKQNLQFKGITHIVRPAAGAASGSIGVARIEYSGNWDPEPGGWRRLSAVMHNQDKTDLKITTAKLGAGQLKGAKLAHITGTTPVTFNDAEGKELKAFVESGGTLLIDSAGGSTEFSASIEQQIAKLFPEQAEKLNQTVASSHAIFPPEVTKGTGPLYRDFSRKRLGRIDGPRLRGIEINGRLAIIFSPDDLSAGMVGMPTDGITGYDPVAATALARKIVLYAAGK